MKVPGKCLKLVAPTSIKPDNPDDTWDLRIPYEENAKRSALSFCYAFITFISRKPVVSSAQLNWLINSPAKLFNAFLSPARKS